MLIFYGVYFFGQRSVAFRNDYCLSCAAPRLAHRVRSIDVGHIFWVPLLPLGVWKRWRCSACGNNPHQQVRTSRGLKWVGIGLLALMALSAWTVDAKKEDDVAVTWLMRIGLPIGVVFAVRATLRGAAPEKLKDKLRGIVPYRERQCPLCQGQLVGRAAGFSCVKCGAHRQDVRAA